jgi:hypothetical protein
MAHIEIIDEYSANIDLFEKYRSILTSYILEEALVVLTQPAKTTDRGIDYQTFEFSENY